MKLSNKILVGFFGFIFLYLSAAFTEIRLTGSPNIINDQNSIAETADLPAIIHLVLNGVDKNININVVGSDKSSLEVRSINGDLLKDVKYAVSGDTLTLTGIDVEDHKNLKITVFVPATNFKAIHANNSRATIKGLNTSLLNIDQSAGEISVTDCNIAKIELNLNAAHLIISEATVETMSVEIEASTVNIHSPLIILQGSLKNQSLLLIEDAQEIQLKKDDKSRLNLYRYR
jgi:hypothetical protein